MARSKYEIRAQKELEDEGWIVDNKSGMGRWAENRDFFNLFDLMAVRPDKNYVRFISIKGKQGIPPTHRRAVKEFKMPKNCHKEIWKRSTSKENYWYKITL